MTVPAWPNNLPYTAKRDGFGLSLSDGNNISATEMDNGEVRYRRRYTTTLSPLSMTIELTSNEVAIFKGFWKDTLKNGTFWFNMPVFNGVDYDTHLVRIEKDGQPRITPIGHDTYELALGLMARNLV